MPLPLATVSSVERIEPVHSKTRERWGHLKSWKRIPGSTKHSGKWVTTSNVKPHVMKQLEQFAYVSGERHISKSSVKAVHVKLPHKMVRDENKLISKSRVDLSRLSRTSLLWSHTSIMWTTGLLRACTKRNRGGWRLTWESGNTVIMLSCPSNLAGWSTGCWWSGWRWPGWSWRIRWQLWVSMKVTSDE